MNSSARITAVSLLAFALGATAGWVGRGSFSSRTAGPAIPVRMQPAPITDAATAEASRTADSAARGAAGSADHRADARSRDAATERLKALVWFKNNGLEYLSLPVFGADGLDPKFIQAFALSPSEAAALNEGFRRARDEITGLARAGATVNVDAQKGMVTVDVPSIPGKGGQVYDALLAQFRNVLGPERFEQFDAVAGSSFEHGLNSFGAEGSKYELTMRTDPQGRPMFEIKRSFAMPDSSGWSGSTLYPEDLARFFPVLSGLVPPGIKPVPAAPTK